MMLANFFFSHLLERTAVRSKLSSCAKLSQTKSVCHNWSPKETVSHGMVAVHKGFRFDMTILPPPTSKKEISLNSDESLIHYGSFSNLNLFEDVAFDVFSRVRRCKLRIFPSLNISQNLVISVLVPTIK